MWWVIRLVEVVFVQGDTPGHLLRERVDPHRACDATDRAQDIAGDLSHLAVRGQLDAVVGAVAVLDENHVLSEVQRDHERSRTVGGAQRGGLPTTGRQAQGRVLEFGFGRCQRDGQLAEQLGVGVKRVARRPPLVERKRRPHCRHSRHLLTREPTDATGLAGSGRWRRLALSDFGATVALQPSAVGGEARSSRSNGLVGPAHESGGEVRLNVTSVSSAAEQFNPFFGPFVEDPAPAFALARTQEPVFFSPLIKSWVVTRHDDVLAVLRDPKRFSSHEIMSIQDLLSPEVAERFGDEIPMEGTLIGLDPPAHTRLRRIMQGAFTPSRVAAREPEIQSLAEDLIDAMVSAAGARHRADVISSVFFPLPLTVVLRLIGIPEEELARSAQACKDWNDLAVAFLSGVPVEEQLRMADAVLGFHRYILELIAERERLPADDLIRALVAMRREEAMNDRELLSLLPGLVLAGHETTANLLGNALAHLLAAPDLWVRLCSGDLPVADVVDEALRYDGPVIGMPRIVTSDTELGGAHVRAGDRLYLAYWSANRDERWLADADEFRPGRTPQAHVAFGRGIHFCIGAPLARLEAGVTLRTLAERLPDLRLAEGTQPQHAGHFFVRRLASLTVSW